MTTGLNTIMSVQSIAVESYQLTLSPYLEFKMALRSREVQRKYPNLLERFLNFCGIEGSDVEQKASHL
jgi:hypothetical protein